MPAREMQELCHSLVLARTWPAGVGGAGGFDSAWKADVAKLNALRRSSERIFI